MAKMTVAKVAKRCLEIAEQLKPRLDDPRIQDLRVSIEQARHALDSGQIPRWQVKRLVDTVALAAMLTGKAKLAEQAFGLWTKAGQSISQNPASLVLEALPDLGKNSQGEVKTETQTAPAPPAKVPSPSAPPPVAPASSPARVSIAPAPAGPPLTSGQPATATNYPQGDFYRPEGVSQQDSAMPPSPGSASEAIAQDLDNTQGLGMGLAAMVSAAYAAESSTAENHPDTAAVREIQKVSPAPQPAEAEPIPNQSASGPTGVPDSAVSPHADWNTSRGQIPWHPVQHPVPAPAAGPGRAAPPANTSSLPMQPQTSPAPAFAAKREFPPRRLAAGRESASQPAPLPPAASVAPGKPQIPSVANPTFPGEMSTTLPVSSPPPRAGEPTSQPENHYPVANAAAAPVTPPARPAPAPLPAVTPQAPLTAPASIKAAPLDDAAIWEYFQKMGFDSKLNMSFEEFVARKNHAVASSTDPENLSVPQPAAPASAPRSAFAEAADDMPDSLLDSQLEEPEISLSPADSALRRAAQSPLAPSRVPPAAPHKPRDILADADRQPSTRLITIRVRGYFDYQPRFTRPKQRLDEPAVAGSTASFAKSIIAAEGPMPLEFLARRLCQKYRIQYHDQRAEEAGRCLGPHLCLVPEPGMRTVWPAGIDPLTWNTALQSPIGLPRKLGSLTLTEIANALRWQISRTNSIERSEIIGEAFKLLYGISPLTPQAVELADRAISYAIANNLLAAGDGTLWLP